MSTVGAMSGTLATIFSLEKSRKWIIREGLKGISRVGSGASMARGLKKSRGLRKGLSWVGWKDSGLDDLLLGSIDDAFALAFSGGAHGAVERWLSEPPPQALSHERRRAKAAGRAAAARAPSPAPGT